MKFSENTISPIANTYTDRNGITYLFRGYKLVTLRNRKLKQVTNRVGRATLRHHYRDEILQVYQLPDHIHLTYRKVPGGHMIYASAHQKLQAMLEKPP